MSANGMWLFIIVVFIIPVGIMWWLISIGWSMRGVHRALAYYDRRWPAK